MLLLWVWLGMSCTGGHDAGRLLDRADSLLRSDRPEEARMILDSIDVSDLSEDEYAYHRLLDIQTSYKLYAPVPSDSTITACVDYWRARNNKSRECLALCYRGLTRYSDGKLEEAASDLKAAESLALGLNDIYLMNKAFSSLTAVNYASGNNPMTFKYAFKELETGRQTGNDRWTAYAYNHLACAYARVKMEDSIYFYIRSIIPLLDKLSDREKAPDLSNIGLYYLNLGDTARALEFGWKSRQALPIASNANLLARIYFSRGETVRADSIWDEAFSSGDLDAKIRIADIRSAEYYRKGMFRESGEQNVILGELKDSVYRQGQSFRLQQLQLDYDHREKMDKSRMQTTALAVLFILIVIATLVTIIVLRNRNRSRMTDSADAIRRYRQRIAVLEDSSRDHDRELKSLRRKIESEVKHNNEMIARGKVLYDSLKDGGENTSRWQKSSFDDFFAYYRVLNSSIFETMEREYKPLSAGNRFLLILTDMGLDSERICAILGISAGSLRSARSRLRGKYIGK